MGLGGICAEGPNDDVDQIVSGDASPSPDPPSETNEIVFASVDLSSSESSGLDPSASWPRLVVCARAGSKASAIASAESSKLAYESILLLTGGSASDSAKKAESLDGFTPR